MRRFALLVLFLPLLTACYEFNNPVDPGGDSYSPGDGPGSDSPEDIPDGSGSATLIASQDTDINNNAMTTNFGTCDGLITNQSGGTDLGDRRLLVQFDLSGIPSGVTIESAELKLTKVDGINVGVDINIHRVTSQWDEGIGNCAGSADTANWYERQGSTGWGTAGGDYTMTLRFSRRLL